MLKKLPNRQKIIKSQTKKVFDKGRSLKTKYKIKETKHRSSQVLSNIKKKLPRLFLILLIVFILIFGINLIIYKSNLNKTIKNFDSAACNSYLPKTNKIILSLTFDKDKNPINSHIFIYFEDKKVNLDINALKFRIDKSGRRGTISDYFASTKYYLNTEETIKNLKNLLLKETFIKADYIISQDNDYTLSRYLEKYNKELVNQIFSPEFTNKENRIFTDICLNTWKNFLNEYNVSKFNLENSKSGDTLNFTDYISYKELIKEQYRVHLINRSGISSMGDFYEKLFKTYGVNIVKIDGSSSTTNDNSIYISDGKIYNSDTIKRIQYILDKKVEVKETKDSSIFGEITIEVGTSSILP